MLFIIRQLLEQNLIQAISGHVV